MALYLPDIQAIFPRDPSVSLNEQTSEERYARPVFRGWSCVFALDAAVVEREYIVYSAHIQEVYHP
jgi:hypothetical protein